MAKEMHMADDVLIEILLRLPVVSLLRFKSVSKQWFRLFSLIQACPVLIRRYSSSSNHRHQKKQENILVGRPSPNIDRFMILSYLSQSQSQSQSISVVSSDWELELDIPGMDTLSSWPYYFTTSLNGLVCKTYYAHGTFICNPALRQSKLIRPNPFDVPPGYFAWPVVAVFGFDSRANTYKIVNLVRFIHDHNLLANPQFHRMQLYDLKSESWTEINIEHVEIPRISPRRGLFFNGVCHWVADTGDGLGYIFCFDLSRETFGRMFFSDDFRRYTTVDFLILKQCLTVVQVYDPSHGGWNQFVDIWVMKEYGVKESWVKEYTLGPLPYYRPLCFINDEMLLFISEGNRQMVSCNLDTNEIQGLYVFDHDGTIGAITYEESLVSVESLIC